MIHVCSLARMPTMVEATGARHIVTLLGVDDPVPRPATVAPEDHLRLHMHDITTYTDGMTMPQIEHVQRLIAFVRRWNRETPIVIHCYAGISRSTAAAFTTACALNPQRDERVIAQALRRASPTALPNSRIVRLADELLGRDGRMIAAVEAIRPHVPAVEADPFQLDLD
jgi:predicted protein tyrosine phosphatase